MIEENENPVRKFDTSRYDIYTIKEAVDVCAIQLNEDITAMLKVQGVARAEWEHHTPAARKTTIRCLNIS